MRAPRARRFSSEKQGHPPPLKRFGQHFLTDPNILNKIVRAAQPGANDTVLEIGPGRASLTHALADSGAQIAAIEIDRELAAQLQTEFAATPNVHIIQGDMLTKTPEAWLAQAGLGPPYKVVANLPYYITSAILRALLEADTRPSLLVVMVQREVAQQIVARPPHMNLLGVSVQFYGAPEIVAVVPAGAFTPRPKVDSAIVRITVFDRPPPVAARLFFRVVRAGFSAKRKQLHNALANGLGISGEQAAVLLSRARVEPARRAETLSLDEWVELAHTAVKLQLVAD